MDSLLIKDICSFLYVKIYTIVHKYFIMKLNRVSIYLNYMSSYLYDNKNSHFHCYMFCYDRIDLEYLNI